MFYLSQLYCQTLGMNVLKRTVCALAVAAMALVAFASPATAIIGGHQAMQFPPMASLWSPHDFGNGPIEAFRCGGTLVDQNWVLTSAHCVAESDDPVTADQLQLRIGSNDRTQGGELFGVKKIVVNPTWVEATADNDLALLQLDHQADIQPVFPALHKLQADTPVSMLGWGCAVLPSDCRYSTLPTVLNQLDTHTLPLSDCAAGLAHPGDVCTAPIANGGQGCAGDSGSPLLYWDKFLHKWELAGVISRDGNADPAGVGTCQQNALSTSVNAHLGWVWMTIWQSYSKR